VEGACDEVGTSSEDEEGVCAGEDGNVVCPGPFLSWRGAELEGGELGPGYEGSITRTRWRSVKDRPDTCPSLRIGQRRDIGRLEERNLGEV